MTQTFIYAIHCPTKREVKIGYAGNPTTRLCQLQTGTTDKLNLLMTFRGGLKEERLIHDSLANYRISGEWFEYNENVLKELLSFLRKSLPSSDPTEIHPKKPKGSVTAFSFSTGLTRIIR
jgi:hypothetical protein